MRIIKFRVWDDNLKVLYTPEMDKEEKNLWRISANGGDFTNSYDNGILMQYTGLKDKNGKEIYEGDLIKINNDKIMKISWSERFASFIIDRDGWAFSHWFGESLNSSECEVIGNIHKNPELL